MAPPRKGGLIVIGVLAVLKASALAFVGLGFLSLLHRDAATTLGEWVERIRVDPRNRIIHALIEKIVGVRPRTLETLGVGTLVYAAVFATEGLGLILQKRWAEYMTLLVTVSFLPVEVFELVEHPRFSKAALLAVNAFVAFYIARQIARERAAHRAGNGRNS